MSGHHSIPTPVTEFETDLSNLFGEFCCFFVLIVSNRTYIVLFSIAVCTVHANQWKMQSFVGSPTKDTWEFDEEFVCHQPCDAARDLKGTTSSHVFIKAQRFAQ